MTQEASTQKVIIISDKSKIYYHDMCGFYLSKIFSDIKIVVEDEEIPAHKIVLAARCEFFNTLLLSHPDMTELCLTNIPLKALKEILKYIYRGSIVISLDKDLLFEVLKLAHDFSLNTFETAMIDKIKSILDLENVCFFLNRANENNFIELRDNCLSFIDKQVLEVPAYDFLKDLNQTSMVQFLQRDSLPIHEIDVFRIAADWCKNNIDVDNSVMNCVRITSLSRKEILNEIWPSKLVDADKLLTAMAAIEDGTFEPPQRRHQQSKDEKNIVQNTENVASPKKNCNYLIYDVQTSNSQNQPAGMQSNTSMPQVSQVKQEVASPTQSTAEPAQPHGPGRERLPIWQGLLKWTEKPKNPADQQKVKKHVPCQVSVISGDGEPELKAEGWPSKLFMQLIPKQLIWDIVESHLNNSNTVLFRPQPCKALDSLKKVMSSGFVGCVHFTGVSNAGTCDIKVLILLYVAENQAYLGVMPNDQAAFVKRLRKIIEQHKSTQIMRQQDGPDQSLNSQTSGAIITMDTPPQMGGNNPATSQTTQQGSKKRLWIEI